MSRLNQQPYLLIYLKKWMNATREIREIDKAYTNEFILMQYTGLKDKNGVEIYEGDIIKTLYNIGVIEWNNKQGRFNVYLNSKGIKNEMNFMKNMADDCQVIGNIYENPEMIKE